MPSGAWRDPTNAQQPIASTSGGGPRIGGPHLSLLSHATFSFPPGIVPRGALASTERLFCALPPLLSAARGLGRQSYNERRRQGGGQASGATAFPPAAGIALLSDFTERWRSGARSAASRLIRSCCAGCARCFPSLRVSYSTWGRRRCSVRTGSSAPGQTHVAGNRGEDAQD